MAGAVVYRLLQSQRHHRALGPAAYGAGMVGEGRGAGAARQDEILERLEILVEGVEFGFQFVDLMTADHLHAGDADLATEIEEVVLDVGEQGPHRLGKLLAKQQADHGVELVDLAKAVDAQAVLGDPVAIAEAGGAGVAGAGVDLRKSVSHGLFLVNTGRL